MLLSQFFCLSVRVSRRFSRIYQEHRRNSDSYRNDLTAIIDASNWVPHSILTLELQKEEQAKLAKIEALSHKTEKSKEPQLSVSVRASIEGQKEERTEPEPEINIEITKPSLDFLFNQILLPCKIRLALNKSSTL